MIKTLLRIFFIIAGLHQVLSSQVKYSNEFLAIGVGARAFALGGSVVGTVNDHTANYWNPAGLSGINTGLQLGVMHTSLFSGIANYDYFGIAKPLKNNQSTFAIGVIRMAVDGIPNTLDLVVNGSIDYDNIKTFSETDYGINFSYARALKNPNFRIGGSVKIVRRNIGSFANSIGFGMDLGLQFQKPKWFFALVGRDLTTTFNSWKGEFTAQEIEVLQSTGNDVLLKGTEITKPTVIIGIGVRSPYEKKHGLLAELNIDATTDGKRNTLVSADPISFNPHLGVEYRYKHLFFLRGGLNNLQKIKDETLKDQTSWEIQPNFGVGLSIGSVKIDYALTNIGNVAQTRLSHVFSLTLDLKGKSKAQ